MTEILTTHGTIESSKQALVKDLKSVIGDADKLISNVASATADELAAARTRVEARLARAKSRVLDAGLAVSDKARCSLDATDAFVHENPWKVLGIAAAAGLVVGAILSRR